MEIRRSFPTDAYEITLLGDLSWKNAYYDVLPNGILNEMTKNLDARVNHLKDQILENNRVLVAVENDKLVGFVFYAKAQNSLYASSAEIRDIYILPEYQRKGIGTELFKCAVEALKKLGFHSMILYCPNVGSSGIFFEKMGGEKREATSRNILNFNVLCDVYYYDLDKKLVSFDEKDDWNIVYETAQNNLHLLNSLNFEIAVVMSDTKNIYLGIGIRHKVCPIESAISNMYLGGDKKLTKILILNRNSKPVLPCGECRDLLVALGQADAEILFDMGTLRTMTMKELNPYYKDEEKV